MNPNLCDPNLLWHRVERNTAYILQYFLVYPNLVYPNVIFWTENFDLASTQTRSYGWKYINNCNVTRTWCGKARRSTRKQSDIKKDHFFIDYDLFEKITFWYIYIYIVNEERRENTTLNEWSIYIYLSIYLSIYIYIYIYIYTFVFNRLLWRGWGREGWGVWGGGITNECLHFLDGLFLKNSFYPVFLIIRTIFKSVCPEVFG